MTVDESHPAPMGRKCVIRHAASGTRKSGENFRVFGFEKKFGDVVMAEISVENYAVCHAGVAGKATVASECQIDGFRCKMLPY